MSFFRSLLLGLVMATLASTAYAAQVNRSMSNTDGTDLYFLTLSSMPTGAPNRQMFRNNLDFANSLWVQIGGQMTRPSTTITVKLYDSCGTLVTQVSQVADNSGLTTPTSRKWVEIALGAKPLVYNAYYYFDVSTTAGFAAPQFVANTNKFVHGTLTAGDVGELVFPDRKRDLLFILSGTTESSKPLIPVNTTNIACPSRCVLANPSGVENVSYSAERHFNVLIRERVTSMNPPKGSFWSDHTAGTIAALKQEIALMLQGTAAQPSLREAYPYNNYAQGSGQPFYYPKMNFYIAIEDPAVDTISSSADGYRGFHHCANIDASIQVVTGTSAPFGGAVGFMWGEVNRPAPSTGGWGTGMRLPLVHEVFGHGVPALVDEYVMTSSGNYHSAMLMSQVWSGNLANALPISTGCNEWCGGTQPVSWLIGQMAGDRDAACWSKTTQSTCESPGGTAFCRWIGGLPAIPYWGTNKCIPTRVSEYNIGTNCSSLGNHGCYPLAPIGTTGGAIMDVVQPSGTIMQSTHQEGVSVPGFTSHVETHIKDMLDCVFPLQPCLATPSRCTNLAARYGTPGSGYKPFLQKANACEGTLITRR